MTRSNALATSLLALLATTPGTLAAAEALRVVAYETEPYLYRVDGRPAGFELEILEYLAKATGKTLELVWVDRFEEVLPKLESGGGDLAAATITITPEREQRFDFSVPYIPVRVMLVEPVGQETKRLADLAGATLVSIKGTTYEELLSVVPRATFVYAAGEEEQFELLASGRARALAVDSAVAFHMLKQYPGLRLGIPLTEEQGFGFAFPKGSPLVEPISAQLRQLKGSNIYYRLLRKHLGDAAVKAVQAARH